MKVVISKTVPPRMLFKLKLENEYTLKFMDINFAYYESSQVNYYKF